MTTTTEGRCETCVRCDRPARHGDLCASCIADDMEFEPDAGSEFDEFDDCGLMPNGQCLKAGSEECDWDCGRLR
ncbi:hypothetical protein [Novosphingobium colocasiae]|uniref:hypothetical protein n=1 Tax=Novosphingobium colocasiae TaxID=1256513 RepID=UPI0035B2886A